MQYLKIYFTVFIFLISTGLTNGINDLLKNDDILVYNTIIEYMRSDVQIREKLSLLLGKNKVPNKYICKGKLNVQVARFLYENIIQNDNSQCAMYGNMRNETIIEKEKLATLSANGIKGKSFLLYFSRINRKYVECKIIQNHRKRSEERFYTNTRFGKVLILQICTENNTIDNVSMSLVTAN